MARMTSSKRPTAVICFHLSSLPGVGTPQLKSISVYTTWAHSNVSCSRITCRRAGGWTSDCTWFHSSGFSRMPWLLMVTEMSTMTAETSDDSAASMTWPLSEGRDEQEGEGAGSKHAQ